MPDNHANLAKQQRSFRYTRRASLDGFVPSNNTIKAATSSLKSGQTTAKFIDFKSKHPRKKSTSKPALPRQHKSAVLHRQAVVKTFTPYQVKSKGVVFERKWAALLSVLVIIFMGTLFATTRSSGAKDVKGKSTTVSSTGKVRAYLDETIITKTAYADYRVAPDMPRYIRIQKLGIDAKVAPSKALNNDLEQPQNIYETAWYSGSAKPGEKGAIIIGGQIAGPTKNGIFYSLGALQPGDKIEIERGDGKKFDYRVAKIQPYDNDKLKISDMSVSAIPDKNALNLVTFTQRYDATTQKYEKRLIVLAVQE